MDCNITKRNRLTNMTNIGFPRQTANLYLKHSLNDAGQCNYFLKSLLLMLFIKISKKQSFF